MTYPGFYDEFKIFFRLQYYLPNGTKGETLLIREPVGWDKLKLTLARDQDYFGVNYEYTDAKNGVEFDGYSGRDFIESYFQKEGEDVTITLQKGIVVPLTDLEIVEYEGRLNFATRKKYKRRVSVGLERKSLQSKMLARWETANAIGTTLQIPLTSQTLTESFKNKVLAGAKVEQLFQGDTNGHVWLQFDTSKPQTAEVEEFAAGKPMGLSEFEGPIANDEWLFKFRSNGTFDIAISLQYRVWFAPKKRTISIGAARVTHCSLTSVLTLLRADGTREDFQVAQPQIIGNAGTTEVILNVDLSDFRKTVEVKKGDRLYLYGLLNFGHNKNELQSTQVQFLNLYTNISLIGQTKNAISSARCVSVYDALNASVEKATDYFDRIRSPFYGLAGPDYAVSGPGSERVLTDGLFIRQYSKPDHALTVSLRDLLSSLQAIDAIGIHFTTELIDPALPPIDVVHIQPVQEYYRPVELLRLDSVADYKEVTIAAELYSTVEIGFEKWIEEGSNALEEVHTTHQVTTPFRNESSKKTLVSKLMTSTLAIERTRREQFVDTPKDGTTYDNDVFLIQCKKIPGYSGPIKLYHGAFNDIIEVPSAITWLTPGMTVFISGSTQNDYPYKVTFVSEKSRTPWTFYVDGASVFTPETVANGQITASQLSPLLPETGADLDSVTGLSAADTAYNLRLTPGRMLFRSIPLWAGCLVDKGDSEQLYKSSVPQNNKLATVILDGDPVRVAEQRAVDVDEIRDRLLFRPRKITFSCRLGRQQIQRLRLGLSGLLPTETDDTGTVINPNFGYVSLLDETGVRVAGFVDTVEWLTTDEKAVFTLHQTALDLNDTTSGLSCAQFAGWTIEQAQNADERTRRRIELCRYIDVDVP